MTHRMPTLSGAIHARYRIKQVYRELAQNFLPIVEPHTKVQNTFEAAIVHGNSGFWEGSANTIRLKKTLQFMLLNDVRNEISKQCGSHRRSEISDVAVKSRSQHYRAACESKKKPIHWR